MKPCDFCNFKNRDRQTYVIYYRKKNDPINPGHAPTWDVMCVLKDICFNDDETVIEYHPSKENYVNIREHCLHL